MLLSTKGDYGVRALIDLAKHTGDLARRLVTVAGFSVREAAMLLSVSPARFDQLVQEPKRRRGEAA